MKKGLLSILAGALVLVGCQNYDDQFDSLESQINVLSATVAGLAQVQSDLASLAGTVASLSSTVNGLGDKIKTEVANGLADIASDVASQGTSVAALQASVTELNTAIANASTSAEIAALTSALAAVQTKLDAMSTTSDAQSSDLEELATGLATLTETIATLQTAVNAAASSEELSTLSDAIAAAQDDLDELLANSTVYSDNITINSVATLNAFHAMGDGLNIVNGNVTFDVSTDMDATKVQAVADQLLTITKDLKYEGDTGTTVPTFKNLTSVVSLTIDAPGDYRFDNLKSATQIVLGDTYESKIGIVHFGALTSYTALKTDGEAANTVELTAATEFHFGSVERLVSNKLDITLKKGSVLDLSSVTGKNVDGDVVTMDLDINGPASFKSATIPDGNMKFTNVASVDVSGFYGKLVISTGVDDLVTSKTVELDISGASDLATATIDIAHDWDPELTAADLLTKKKAGAQDVEIKSQDLTTATVTGVPGTITATAQNNLNSLTVLSTGGEDLIVTNNTDLTELIVKGSTLSDVTFTGNDAITLLDLDYTTGFKTGSTAKGGVVNVSSNDDLATLHVSADKIYDFTVKNNAKLATVDFTGMKVIGNTTAAADIQGNNLTATSAVDTWQDADGDGTAETGDGQGDEEGTSTDKGTYTTESGLKTIYTWLSAATTAGPATGGSIIVAFDKVSSSTDKAEETANDSTTDPYTVDLTDYEDVAYVAYITPDVADSTPTVRENESYVAPLLFDGVYNANAMITGESIAIDTGDITKTFSYTATTLDSVSELISAINDATGWDTNVSVTAVQDAGKRGYFSVDMIQGTDGTATKTAAVTQSDTFGWVFGTATGTHTITATQTGGLTSALLASEIASALNLEISTGGVQYKVEYAGSGNDFVVSELMTGSTSNVNDGKTISTIPSFSFDLDTNLTSVDFNSGTGTNSSVGTSGTNSVTLIYNRDVTSSLRINIKNNSTTVALAGTGVEVTTNGATTGLFGSGTDVELASGTSMYKDLSVVAGFDEISTTGAATEGEDTNRVSWLK